MTRPLLAAALIVKDEAANLPGCLEALAALGDLIAEVVVYDTGSTDGTPGLAGAAGARVELGHWDDDFARARNAAVAMTRAPWVLIVDADERVIADPVLLRAVLEGGGPDGSKATRGDALALSLVNLAPDGTQEYAAPQIRIFRPDRAGYVGRLHERVERRDGGRLRYVELGRDVVEVRHHGYTDPVVVRRKAERNLELAASAVRAAMEAPEPDPGELVRALYHRGRTMLSAGRVRDALEDLQAMRALATPTPERTWGTDVLAQILIGLGRPGEVGPLLDELRGAQVNEPYCAWLAARAHLLRQEYAEALALLRTIDRLVDSAGRVLDLAPVVEAQLISAGRVGNVDEASACCIRLMAGFGWVEGYGSLLVTLWGDRPAAWLAELLTGADHGHLGRIADELNRCAAPGPEVAALLAGGAQPMTSSAVPSAQPA